ncbi:MAG: S8 family serine peptidase, partial [Anaerolineae bacterium]|nr:S8 family serine peptidase [Anaerolineae bacterium]
SAPPTDQIIVKYRELPEVGFALAADAPEQLARLSTRAGIALAYFRPMSGDAHVLRLPQRLPVEEVDRIAAQLSTLPEVEYAEPDAIMLPAQITPNDPQYNAQWHYFESYGIDLPQAWTITRGMTSTVVAVIDTGHRPHADLAARIVGGYDFIADTFVSNDGNGRDNDPSDPGDWVSANQCGGTHPARNSSWHGTHVAGTIGAITNNGVGVAGVNWHARILSVRVLGKCGGYTSDIVDGMRWAAGLPVSGVPNNTTPAKVLNLSLGGSGSCGATYQNAINAINAAGAIIVVAAGNSNADAANARPANCSGVITVGATNRSGVRASYSNYGSVVDISAPGGQTSPTLNNGVLSTLNSGTTAPGADSYAFYQGTSMAAPHVAGVVSLMVALRPYLNYTQTESILKATAKPFGSGHTCSGTTTCGAGIVNAYAALQVLSKLVFVPIVHRHGSGGSGSWTTIMQETFEGAFPSSGWTIYDDSASGYQWGRRNCSAFAGSFSAWAVGGGTNGSNLGCSANYPNYVNTWMVYGPFSLAGATAAELTFRYRLNTEPTYDGFFWGASTDGINFIGSAVSGAISGWSQGTLNLNSYVGLSQVWVGFNFYSNFSVTYPVGVMVDDILLRRCTGGTCSTVMVHDEEALGSTESQTPTPTPAVRTVREVGSARPKP